MEDSPWISIIIYHKQELLIHKNKQFKLHNQKLIDTWREGN